MIEQKQFQSLEYIKLYQISFRIIQFKLIFFSQCPGMISKAKAL